jgi:hypothetical protein
MAVHLTLEEAADRLGISPEEFKKRLKTHAAFKTLVPIRDGSNLRFKEAAIDELARELGAGSNPENPLPPPSSKKKDDEPLKFAEESDVFSLSGDEGKPAPPAPTKKGSDSDVRLDAEKPKSGKIAKNTGGEAVATEEISIDFSGPGSAVIKGGSSSKLSAPKSGGKVTSDSGKSLSKPGSGGDSSEFELSLDADSDDFELKLNTETSDEVALGEMPSEKDVTGSSGRRGGASGILSRSPSDSGISLEKEEKAKEKGKGKDDSSSGSRPDSDSDLDFELTLDSSSAVSGTKLGGMKGKKADDSDSEFELTLDDSSGGAAIDDDVLSGSGTSEKGDIFETDFEIPPMGESDSGSEAVALESSDTDLEKSDFDVAIDDSDSVPESGSEVVLLEDEEDGSPKAKKKPAKKPAKVVDDGDVDLADVEEEEESSVSKALKGAKARRDEDEEEEEAAATVPAGAYQPVPWGPVPMIFLLPAFLLMLVGAIMSYELVHTMTGYQQPRKPAAPLVNGVAGALDMQPAGQ